MAKNRAHDVRGDGSRRDAAEKIARELLEHLALGHGTEARARTTRRFRWFSKTITRSDWAGDALVSFFLAAPTTIASLRSIDSAVLALFPSDELTKLFDGPLAEKDRVFLADVSRGGHVVTVALVVVDELGEPRVDRVVDPSAFAEKARALKG